MPCTLMRVSLIRKWNSAKAKSPTVKRDSVSQVTKSLGIMEKADLSFCNGILLQTSRQVFAPAVWFSWLSIVLCIKRSQVQLLVRAYT